MWMYVLIDGLAVVNACVSLIGGVEHDYVLMVGTMIIATFLLVFRTMLY